MWVVQYITKRIQSCLSHQHAWTFSYGSSTYSYVQQHIKCLWFPLLYHTLLRSGFCLCLYNTRLLPPSVYPFSSQRLTPFLHSSSSLLTSHASYPSLLTLPPPLQNLRFQIHSRNLFNTSLHVLLVNVITCGYSAASSGASLARKSSTRSSSVSHRNSANPVPRTS